ncbi:MAG TPA: hypothetical protein VJB08_00020 [Candidatus Nanoarchaeia archaeon]|nr:hypothetical protein [Candidatus Nanoarchaeia archaeon]
MEKQVAEKLFNELGRHPGIMAPQPDLFLDVLVSAEVPESEFYQSLPHRQQLLEEPLCYHYLSLSGVFQNRNAQDHYVSPWKRRYEAVASAIGLMPSDSLIRSLRADWGLIESMERCEDPFSLLAQFQTYDYDNPEETLFILTRPILVIPDAADAKSIYEWEEAHTLPLKEVGAVFRHQKRITMQDYLSH